VQSTSSSTQIGAGLVRNTAKISASAGQRLLAAGEQRQRRRLLAGRLGEDLEAGFQRIVVLDQLQLGGAAAEQLGEQPLEVALTRRTRRAAARALPC
jgi:hypothetical protein